MIPNLKFEIQIHHFGSDFELFSFDFEIRPSLNLSLSHGGYDVVVVVVVVVEVVVVDVVVVGGVVVVVLVVEVVVELVGVGHNRENWKPQKSLFFFIFQF